MTIVPLTTRLEHWLRGTLHWQEHVAPRVPPSTYDYPPRSGQCGHLIDRAVNGTVGQRQIRRALRRLAPEY